MRCALLFFCLFYSSSKLEQLAEAVGVDLVREELIGQYVQLLKDTEAEVRTAAAGQIPGNLAVVNFDAFTNYT